MGDTASRHNNLKSRHSEIERQIAELLSHPSSDDVAIQALKKKKLAIKEEIVRIAPDTC